MTAHDSTMKLRALALAALMVGSVVGAGITFSGVAVAANTTAQINSIESAAIDGSQKAEFVNPNDDVSVTYTVDSASDTAITSASVVFEDINDGTTVKRSVTADNVEGRQETVAAPDEEGFYSVTFEVTDEDGVTDKHEVTADGEDGFLVVHTTEPTVNIESPGNGDAGSYPLIKGTAVDGAGIDNVTLSIKDDDTDNYWNATTNSWQSDATSFVVKDATVTYGETVSWSYDIYEHKSKFDAGEYTFTTNAYDGRGNKISEPEKTGPPDPEDDDDTAPASVGYELVVSSPTITDITFLESDFKTETSTVHEATDDVIRVNVTVDQRGTAADSIGPAAVESTALGIDSTELSEVTSYGESGKLRYQGEVSLGEPTVPEGDIDVMASVESSTVTVTDDATIELKRAPAAVESFSVETDFIGFVNDEADSIEVTVDDVVDTDGNPVDLKGGEESLTVTIGSKTIASDITVTDGSVDNTADITIDPDTDLPVSEHEAGPTTVQVEYDKTGKVVSDEYTVDLVHEVYALETGTYQAVGTPMQATDVSIDADSQDVITWDPAADGGDGDWVSVNDATEAGAGYFVYTDDEDARIGYEFETGSATGSEETLEGGSSESRFHLVGATPLLQQSDPMITIDEDLKGGEGATVDDAEVTAWTDDNAPKIGPDATSGSASWSEDGDISDSVDQFEAYWVEVDPNTELIRSFETEAYNPEQRANELGS